MLLKAIIMEHTDKEKLLKGIQTLVMSLLFMLLGPGLIYEAFKNQGHYLWIPVLIGGIACFTAAIFFGFKGINKIIQSMFGNK